MAAILEFEGENVEGDIVEYIEGIPARNILATDWDTLPEAIQDRAIDSGLYVAATGTADPIDPESPPV